MGWWNGVNDLDDVVLLGISLGGLCWLLWLAVVNVSEQWKGWDDE